MAAGRSLPMRSMLRMAAPAIIRLASAYHRATEAAGQADVAALLARLDQIDAWIEEGLLGGAELNPADFQIAVNVSAMLRFKDTRRFIVGRPAATLARRVAPDYAGHVGPVLPAAWLRSLDDAPSRGHHPQP